jgi:hypothetical protein
MDAPQLNQLEGVFGSVLSVALGLVGVVVLVMILVGGFKYINSGGDKEAASKARLTLTHAFLGLTLAVSAWMILNILGQFLGVDFSTFKITI